VGLDETYELHLLIPDPFAQLDAGIPEDLAKELSARFPSGRICLVLEERQGFALANPFRAADPFRIAAAVAVMKTACSWDESDPIVVVVREVTVRVSLAFDETGWRVWQVA